MTTTLLEADTMGRVLAEATIENLEDLWAAKRGLRSSEEVRGSSSRMPSSIPARPCCLSPGN